MVVAGQNSLIHDVVNGLQFLDAYTCRRLPPLFMFSNLAGFKSGF